MIIDLREIPTVWINLDSATQNAEDMKKRLELHNFKNTDRKSACVIPAPPNTISSNLHYVGCAQSHIDILEDKKYPTPLLILEDDAEFSDSFNPILDVPDDADGVYLGVSTGNMGYQTKKVNDNFYRIGGILATHAILYITEQYRQNMSIVAKQCVYQFRQPWDVGASSLQFHMKVYTPIKPFFYQADNRQSANKWQFFTDQQLEDRNSNLL